MLVSIPSEFEKFVQAEIAGGRYANVQEVLTESLRILRDESQLQAEIAAGIAEVERGEVIGADEVFRKLRRSNAPDGESQ